MGNEPPLVLMGDDPPPSPRLSSGTLELDYQVAFELIDKNGDGKLTRAEIIKGCRSDQRVRELLQLPATIRQEDGTRDVFEKVYQLMDKDDSKSIDITEFKVFWLQNVRMTLELLSPISAAYTHASGGTQPATPRAPVCAGCSPIYGGDRTAGREAARPTEARRKRHCHRRRHHSKRLAG